MLLKRSARPQPNQKIDDSECFPVSACSACSAVDLKQRLHFQRSRSGLTGRLHGRGLERVRRDLIRAKPRWVVEDLGGDDQLVRPGAGGEIVEPTLHGGRRAHRRAGQHLVEDRPGRRVRRLTTACSSDVASRAASWWVSAATTFTPSIRYGRASCAEGRNWARYSSIACISSAGAKCDAKAYGRPSRAAR